jgi:hypothetical protein
VKVAEKLDQDEIVSFSGTAICLARNKKTIN